MFDLEQQMAEWRNRLASALGDDTRALDELESHLRDEIDGLVRKGNTLETAVQHAVAKLGESEMLAREFGKNSQPWWPIYAWSAVMLLVVGGSLIGSQFIVDAGNSLLLGIHVASITIGYVLSYGIG